VTGATTDRKSVLAVAPTETGTRVVTAVATTITSNDAEVGQAGAAAATPLSFIWPAQVPALVTALAETLDAHRDLESATGRAMQQALLSLIPLSSGEALVAVSGALLGTLETATNEADPATRMAIESVAPAAVSPAGRELVSGLVPGWRNRYDTTVANAGELRPPLLALCAAADHEAFAEDQEQVFWDRLQALPLQGGVMPEVAAVAMASMRWRPQHRAGATQTIADVWEQLDTNVHSEIVGRVAGWPPVLGELAPRFTVLVATHVLEHEDADTREAWVNRMWVALQPSNRARILAEAIDSIASLPAKVVDLDVDELLESLHRASATAKVLPLVEAAKNCPEGVRSEAAKRFILGSFDDADRGWNDQSVQWVVGLLSQTPASESVEAAVPYLSSGATQAGRAASVLGWIRSEYPEAVSPANDAIADAINDLLPHASPDLAGRLGAASHGISWNRFDGTVKEMRKRRDEHDVREAALAFESAGAAAESRSPDTGRG
jgi:hypothetical protein